MKNYFIICIFVYAFASCNTIVLQNKYESKVLKELYRLESSANENLTGEIIFCKTNDTLIIGCSNLFVILKELKNNPHYKDKNYEEIISDMVLFKKEFSCNATLIEICFSLDDTIMQTYQNNDFDFFLSLFSKTTNNSNYGEYIINSSELTTNSLYTVMYCFSLNHYYCSFVDYEGYWYCKKIDDFYSKILNIDVYD